MKNIIKHAHRHLKGHINDHKHHYLFGLFGGFALFKLFLLLTGLTITQYSVFTNAQLDEGCVLTGQYYTGEYETGCIEIPEEITGGYLTGCEIIPGYRTGGTLNESGDLVDQIRIDAIETGCYLTGYTIIPAYTTGCYLTGGYRTGGTLLCGQEQGTGDEELGTSDEGLGTRNEGLGTRDEGLGDRENICTNGDVIWNQPLVGNSVRNVFDISWSYSGCIVSGTILQLWDHNEQWITLADLDAGATHYSFDSTSLYSFQQSGFYHVIGTNMSGNDYYLYTGQYTGTYSHVFDGYKIRLLDTDQNILHETSSFTIDNEVPSLTGVVLTFGNSTTGAIGLSGVVTLSFTASEALNGGVTATLGSGKVPTTTTISNLTYTYTRTLNSLYTEGPLVADISFADAAGNTGALVYTSQIIFDYTLPEVTGFVFTGSDHGLFLDFTTSEPTRVEFDYWKSGSVFVSGIHASYLTAHQLDFSGIVVDQLYNYTITIADRAGNSVDFTGDVMRTSLGQYIFHVNLVDTIDEGVLSGSVATLTSILKEEIGKFNACKDAITYTPVELEIRRNSFMIQMPDFKKSQVKTLVNAFTLFVLDKVKSNYKISKSDIEDITKKFDSFLIVLKLLRDDDNTCKQNLSNYHISQFTRVMEEYGIALE